MTEIRHTAGPWRICTTGNLSNVVEGNSGRPLFDGDTGFRPVAMFQSCCSSQMHADQEANALANGRLIAAAPDLLQELEGIVHFADGFGCYHDQGPLGQALRQWINGARAAIKRATEG